VRSPIVIAAALACVNAASAFGPGAHAYLAMKALRTSDSVAIYAAALPDMNGSFAATPQAASHVKHLTHYEYERLAPSCFAAGFATHNNVWGADAIAHAYFVEAAPENYVTAKIHELSARCGITLHEAEDLFDAGLDIALATGVGPSLGRALADSTRRMGAAEEDALVAAYAAPLAEEVGLTVEEAGQRIRWAERCMRTVMQAYGNLLQGKLMLYRPVAAWMVGRAFHWKENDARTRLDTAISLAFDCIPALDLMAEELRTRLLSDPVYADCAQE
jgi:hypothetical protein